ncbi:Aspartate-semialdehyde dehydrogenase [Streptomyces venezuelae]|uniref:aspartate-semialdehyde dehydrogenase n=1 Tax=Streptomyces gardneri TaxID=66892 RepID=UPI0006BCD31F|nr:aspartate-semialdehyde dehydrogenase [Streptomyces gardneri]ALO09396.1 Aspartate-semialdehyde dehydrogenase [Streptomyces venezuelae]QPK46504.1 aspartate-semialdehyde dehydrogenase [Streptomyces gardneri]WRK37893.1 aspartate-semialdehyde dehydrogenase [Streptomyces venezuelae]CUM40191.1 Aspartate-semialdehyde dehydrogenase [Streptomyces venezuelae]
MTPKPTLAVVGATGAVGSVMLQMLTHHADVWGEIRLLDTPGAAGSKAAVRGVECEVRALDEDSEESLDGVDLALFLVPEAVAARWAPVAVAKGAVVVDTSAAFRGDADVPLVVPEVNAHAARVRPRGIVASPGCTTLALIAAVGALHAEFGLAELVVTAQQAASGAGAGQAGVDALRAQLGLVAGDGELGTQPGDVRRAVGENSGPFPGPLALNVLPWSGTAGEDGASSEEERVRDETRRVLGLPGLRIAATCLRVPVVSGHSVSVHARFEHPVTVGRAHEVLATSPGVVLYDDPEAGDFPTPADVVGTDPAWVGRVRRSMDDERALDFFVCADNLRKGAALNALQIAESVVTDL